MRATFAIGKVETGKSMRSVQVGDSLVEEINGKLVTNDEKQGDPGERGEEEIRHKREKEESQEALGREIGRQQAGRNLALDEFEASRFIAANTFQTIDTFINEIISDMLRGGAKRGVHRR